MAKRSKTQRAKASANRQAKKAERLREEELGVTNSSSSNTTQSEAKPEESKGLFKKFSKNDSSESKKPAKKEEKKPKKVRFQFLRDVRAELKRVTWPTKKDVLRWSGVVVAALLFFGIFTSVLDNLVVTPLLVLISSINPAG